MSTPVDDLAALIAQADGAMARIRATENGHAHPLAPDTTFTAADLHGMAFAPLPWAIPGLLPQGAALLCGPPKAGKSRLVLGLAAAIAYGGIALSHTEVAQGEVLVLALEDGKRRLHERLAALLAGEREPWPTALRFATEWPRIGQGGCEKLDAHLVAHPDTRLVVVDVLQMIRPASAGRDSNAYAGDYTAMRALKHVADAHDVTLLVLHHTRKMDANDPVSLVSGTNGLAGAVDSILILQREPNGGDATLYLRGRDVEEAQFLLAYDRTTGAWSIAGAARAEPLSDTREAIISALESTHPEPQTPKQIAAATGLTETVVYQRLHHLEQAGKLHRVGRGQYMTACPPDSLPPRTGRKDRKEGGEMASVGGIDPYDDPYGHPYEVGGLDPQKPQNGADPDGRPYDLTILTTLQGKEADGVAGDDWWTR